MKWKSPYLVEPHEKLRLAHRETSGLSNSPFVSKSGVHTPETAAPVLVKHRDRLAKLQEVLYASQTHSVLIVLQGMDTAGKDGTISHIFSGINPQGCDVASFKVPTPLEARHDFLWRVHEKTPPRGQIVIFNRSHYEDVLSPRVHKLIDGKTVKTRLDQINAFEESLHDNGTLILKFFLHISHDEQTRRLQARIDDPEKHWKLSDADFKERQFWPQYQDAYEEAISRTSRKHAPWFVIPANHKWYRNLAISEILVEGMKSLKLEYPKPTMDASKIKL
ncbi:polyphosphate:nucleotide phosphotransferase, PPK2 family [Granulicella rosea]|uniref:Polyphosphate:nucleotide phosphotransferase, PPK2 family n=1 Tax=Granulicella rosea TaxID=474952 RepID=A0A239JUJ7_9BACT|nr:polyphosphate kinase 2 family protein [Granulicella rosea]SNT08554.1 polyphosphate:nucleotide phosphotransferase, PPK2 family [Granulicella rosea]